MVTTSRSRCPSSSPGVPAPLLGPGLPLSMLTGATTVEWVPGVHSQPAAKAAAAAQVPRARGGPPSVCQPGGVTVIHPGAIGVGGRRNRVK